MLPQTICLAKVLNVEDVEDEVAPVEDAGDVAPANNAPANAPEVALVQLSPAERLEQIEDLRDKGLISNDEYGATQLTPSLAETLIPDPKPPMSAAQREQIVEAL